MCVYVCVCVCVCKCHMSASTAQIVASPCGSQERQLLLLLLLLLLLPLLLLTTCTRDFPHRDFPHPTLQVAFGEEELKQKKQLDPRANVKIIQIS